MTPGDDPLAGALSRQLQRMSGVEVPQSAWQGATLPPHLIMRFEVRASDGRTLRAGRDLAALQADYAAEVEDALLHFSGEGGIEREAVTDWNFGDLEESVDMERGGVTMRGWPALEATSGGVGVKLFATEAAARAAMPRGVRALYREVLREEVRYLRRKLPAIDVLALRFTPFGDKKTLIEDIIDAAIDATFIDPDDLPRTRDAFRARLDAGRGELVGTANGIAERLAQVFEQHRQVARRMEGNIPLSWIEAVGDVRDQIRALLYPGFVSATGVERLERLPVYLQAIDRRLDGIDKAPDKDRARRAELLPVWEAFKGDAGNARGRRGLQRRAPGAALGVRRAARIAVRAGSRHPREGHGRAAGEPGGVAEGAHAGAARGRVEALREHVGAARDRFKRR